MSSRNRMRLGFALAYGILIVTAVLSWLQRPPNPPQIQGVLLPQAQPLAAFSLIDHRGDRFANEHLRGQWHLVSYGFTNCPDICPTTLSQLLQMRRQLGTEEQLQVLFYTVDHRRDTAGQLARYLSYFDSAIIGLTHIDNPDNPHLPFEHSLGITARLEPIIREDGSVDPGDYRVNHSIVLLLLNPRGELQAIFKPREIAPGVQGFETQELLRDYRAVRAFTG